MTSRDDELQLLSGSVEAASPWRSTSCLVT